MKQTMKDIEVLLTEITDEQDARFSELLQDERKGVQRLIAKWRKQKEQTERERAVFIEMSQFEQTLRATGIQYIAGVDEVGRGPLAGPVVAAAVILPPDFYLPGVNDSKKLSEAKREEFSRYIKEHALTISVGIVDADVIDTVNIYQATKQAMQKAIQGLTIQPEHLLIDAMELPLELPQTSIIKGDAKSISIAAASIIAKVTRDNMMKELGEQYPAYGFERHMGYGTKEHLEAIETYGILPVHRKSFAPIKEQL
ncbi:ribonuclease HII [Ectobacillus antri]|jgi:ribonuclease HII|uniref:Ribonuclease HII n=1 Tax=Ectobacillus antri TaxID=2486280 RepID=A0ABT6H2B2_9BACI|nr:ribonuclease HII [Ectobacillus antri]MDG4655916.1 ribonuclease HII [Ectobacillus antri]MDG5752591.1 ribonuclease HII [Ectobacillus antri]